MKREEEGRDDDEFRSTLRGGKGMNRCRGSSCVREIIPPATGLMPRFSLCVALLSTGNLYS